MITAGGETERFRFAGIRERNEANAFQLKRMQSK